MFSFITESIHDISKFDIYLKNRKREHIKFMENEEKIPQFNFVIEAIYTEIIMKGDFDKEEIKKLLNKTLKDIQKFEKFSQEDKKKKRSAVRKNRLQHKVTSLLEEKKALKKLDQMPLEDKMAQEVVKRELAMENKKKWRYVQQQKLQFRKPSKRVYFQESEESESSDEEIRHTKHKRS